MYVTKTGEIVTYSRHIVMFIAGSLQSDISPKHKAGAVSIHCDDPSGVFSDHAIVSLTIKDYCIFICNFYSFCQTRQGGGKQGGGGWMRGEHFVKHLNHINLKRLAKTQFTTLFIHRTFHFLPWLVSLAAKSHSAKSRTHIDKPFKSAFLITSYAKH